MELIKHDTHIDFVGRIKLAGFVSAVLVLVNETRIVRRVIGYPLRRVTRDVSQAF